MDSSADFALWEEFLPTAVEIAARIEYRQRSSFPINRCHNGR
jgi:hypothetical protein